jgi:hypothetical protein
LAELLLGTRCFVCGIKLTLNYREAHGLYTYDSLCSTMGARCEARLS